MGYGVNGVHCPDSQRSITLEKGGELEQLSGEQTCPDPGPPENRDRTDLGMKSNRDKTDVSQCGPSLRSKLPIQHSPRMAGVRAGKEQGSSEFPTAYRA